jgi:cysteine-rich repeat protein
MRLSTFGLIGGLVASATAEDLLFLEGFQYREYDEAVALGYTVKTVTEAEWAALTTADFAEFKAIIIPDPACQSSPASIKFLDDSKDAWSPAVTGNIILIGTDTSFHFAQGGAKTLIDNSVNFAAAGKDTAGNSLTGLYFALSCYYDSVESATVDALSRIGDFTVRGNLDCYNKAHLVASSEALTSLDDAALSNWGCSVHEAFSSYPSVGTNGFQTLAIAQDILGVGSQEFGDGTVGLPYILSRGATPAKCGDGKWDESLGEECDDGNTENGDGCSLSCKCESGFLAKGDGTCEPEVISSSGTAYSTGVSSTLSTSYGVSSNTSSIYPTPTGGYVVSSSAYPASNSSTYYPTASYPAGYPSASESSSYPVGYPTGYPSESPSYPVGYPSESPSYPAGYPAESSSYPTGYPAEISSYPAGYPSESQSYPVGYPSESPTYPVGYPHSSYPAGHSHSAYDIEYPHSSYAANPTSKTYPPGYPHGSYPHASKSSDYPVHSPPSYPIHPSYAISHSYTPAPYATPSCPKGPKIIGVEYIVAATPTGSSYAAHHTSMRPIYDAPTSKLPCYICAVHSEHITYTTTDFVTVTTTTCSAEPTKYFAVEFKPCADCAPHTLTETAAIGAPHTEYVAIPYVTPTPHVHKGNVGAGEHVHASTVYAAAPAPYGTGIVTYPTPTATGTGGYYPTKTAYAMEYTGAAVAGEVKVAGVIGGAIMAVLGLL